MPVALLDLLTLVVVAVVLRARPAVVLGVLVTTVVVVPATLIVPHTHIPYSTFLHIVTVAAALRLLLMRLDRTLVRGVLKLTPAHVALGLLVVVVFATGIVFVVNANAPGGAESRLIGLLQQVVFLVVCVALMRQVGEVDAVLVSLTVAVSVSAGIGIIEHFTSASWGHWLFSNLHLQTDAGHPLSARGAALRVRGGAEFALEYAWLMVMLLPAAVVTAVRHRWWQLTVPLAIAAISLSVYWSYTRSALAGLIVALVGLAVFSRERRVVLAVAGSLAGYAVVYLLHPVIATHFTEKFAQGSVTTRFERLMPLLHDAAAHPFRGLGLGELLSTGFKTTDNAFLLQYIEVGVIGVAVLAVLLLVVLGQAVRGLAIADDRQRSVAAAVVCAVVAYVVSAMFFDAFTLQQAPCLLWFFVGLGVLTAEQSGIRLRLPRPRRLVLGVAAAASVAGGVGVYVLAPVHTGQDFYFTTLPGYSDALPYDITLLGQTTIGTACSLAALEDAATPGAAVSCSFLSSNAGFGQLHLEADSAEQLTALRGRLTTFERQHGDPWFASYALDRPSTDRHSAWRTAPLWVPMGVVLLLLLLPWRGPWRPDPAGARSRLPAADWPGSRHAAAVA